MTSLSPSDTDGGYLNETVPPVRTSTGPCRVQQNPPYKPSDMFVLQGLPRPPLRKVRPPTRTRGTGPGGTRRWNLSTPLRQRSDGTESVAGLYWGVSPMTPPRAPSTVTPPPSGTQCARGESDRTVDLSEGATDDGPISLRTRWG